MSSAGTDVGLREVARRARVSVIRAVKHAGVGHLGGPLSAMDLLVALYFREMDIRPREPNWPDRDRFILSKGHSSIGLYAVMAHRGYFPVEELLTFDQANSRLQGHPDMTKLPGLDMSTGSLGMGLSAGIGMALGARLDGQSFRTYVMLGDGECQEGQVWEAAFVAARYGLDNLVAVVDCNRLQQYGWQRGEDVLDRLPPQRRGELAAKWKAFGWNAVTVDGHNMESILGGLDTARAASGQPIVVLANTVKGKGVSFMENKFFWHTRVLTEQEYDQALSELGEPQAGVG
jgi:transketolase